MFDIGSTELLLCAAVALVVIGPKDLPKAMRVVGRFVSKARGMARHMRSGFDDMVREAELAELEKSWAEENERVMRDYPADGDAGSQPMLPSPPPASELDPGDPSEPRDER